MSCRPPAGVARFVRRAARANQVDRGDTAVNVRWERILRSLNPVHAPTLTATEAWLAFDRVAARRAILSSWLGQVTRTRIALIEQREPVQYCRTTMSTVEQAGAQFRVCLIGCGSMSSSAHGPSLQLYANTVSWHIPPALPAWLDNCGNPRPTCLVIFVRVPHPAASLHRTGWVLRPRRR